MSKPVGLKLPNGYGLYDMHGNLSEWTHDYVSGGQSGADGWVALTQNGTVDVAGFDLGVLPIGDWSIFITLSK